jgi:hypothetical protein
MCWQIFQINFFSLFSLFLLLLLAHHKLFLLFILLFLTVYLELPLSLLLVVTVVFVVEFVLVSVFIVLVRNVVGQLENTPFGCGRVLYSESALGVALLVGLVGNGSLVVFLEAHDLVFFFVFQVVVARSTISHLEFKFK